MLGDISSIASRLQANGASLEYLLADLDMRSALGMAGNPELCADMSAKMRAANYALKIANEMLEQAAAAGRSSSSWRRELQRAS